MLSAYLSLLLSSDHWLIILKTAYFMQTTGKAKLYGGLLYQDEIAIGH